MDKIDFKPSEEYKPGDIIITAEQIQTRCGELAGEIAEKYKGKNLLVIGILKGAIHVMSDMVRLLQEKGLTDMEIDFLQVHSYAEGTTASYEPKMLSEGSATVSDKHILLIDDISDTGKSIKFVMEHLASRHPESLQSLVLLDKPSRRTTEFNPDFVGFTIPDIWVQGYGMDTDEKGRGDRNIIKGPYTY